MKIGDIINIHIDNQDDPLQGIIHYHNPNELYAQAVLFNNNYEKKCTNRDWVGFTYKVTINNELKVIPKDFVSPYLSSKTYFADIDEVDSVYNGLFDELEINKYYKMITNNNDNLFKSDTYIRFINNDKKNKRITCQNTETNEEIEIDVEYGINFLNNDKILYLKNTNTSIDSYDDTEDSDSDSHISTDIIDEVEIAISIEIPQDRLELKDSEKYAYIISSLREMFSHEQETLKSKNIAPLITRVFNLLKKNKSDYKNLNWEKLNWKKEFDENCIIPIISFDDTMNCARVEYLNNDSYSYNTYKNESHKNLSYDEFVSHFTKELNIYNGNGENGENVEYDTKVLCEHNLKYDKDNVPIFNKDNFSDLIVLQSTYNFADKISIEEYLVNPTKENRIIKKFPPTEDEFNALHKNTETDIFSILNISIDDIPFKYIRKISKSGKYFFYDNIINNKKTDSNSYNTKIILLNKLGKLQNENFSFNFDEFKEKNIKMKFTNSMNINTKKIDSLIWENNNIWPHNLAKSILENELDETEALQFIYEFENINKFYISEKISKKEQIKGKNYIMNKFNESVVSNNSNIGVSESISVSYSETQIVWGKADKITNLKEKNETKIDILTNGKYVRNAIYGKEDPFWFYDIFTGNRFQPIYTIFLLKKDIIINQRIKTTLNNCLKHQWGVKHDDSMHTITSIVNDEILGYEEDNTDDTISNRTKNLNNYNNKRDETLDDIDIEFENNFKNIAFTFTNKLVSEINKNKKYILDDKILAIDSLNCFLQNKYYKDYNIFFNKKIFAKTTKLIVFKENVNIIFNYLQSNGKKNKKDITDITKEQIREANKTIEDIENDEYDDDDVKDIIEVLYDVIKESYKKHEKSYMTDLTKKLVYIISSKIITSLNIESKLVSDSTNKTYKDLYTSSLSLSDTELLSNAQKYWNYNINSFDYEKYKLKKGIFIYTKEVNNSKIIINNPINDYNLSVCSNTKLKNPKIKIIESVLNTNYDYFINLDFESYTNKNAIMPQNVFLKESDQYLLEKQYQCLFKKFINIILIPKSQLNDFKISKYWKQLNKEKHQTRVSTWITFRHDFEIYITNLQNWSKFLNIIKNDMIEFKTELKKYQEKKKLKNENITWKQKWTFLIYYLHNIIPNRMYTNTLRGEYELYNNILTNVLNILVKNVSTISQKYMTTFTLQKIQQELAVITEDEARKFFNKTTNRDEQKLIKQDQKRKLGSYDVAQQVQYGKLQADHNDNDDNDNDNDNNNNTENYFAQNNEQNEEIEEYDSDTRANMFDNDDQY